MGEGGPILILAIGVVLGIAGAAATTWLVARVWKRRREAPIAVKVLAAVVLVSATFAGLGMLIGLVMAFTAVGGERLDPLQKARALAEGIALAMNCTSLGVAVWLPSVIAGFVITRSRNRQP